MNEYDDRVTSSIARILRWKVKGAKVQGLGPILNAYFLLRHSNLLLVVSQNLINVFYHMNIYVICL